MKDIKKINKDIQNILILIFGTGFSQVIPFVVLPLISRFYTAVEFGNMSFYVSCVSILVIFATGRYDDSILIENKKLKVVNLIAGTLIISFFVSILIALILLILKFNNINFFNFNQLGNWVLLIPVSVFILSIFNIFTVFANRYKFFRQISTSNILKSTTTSSVKVLGGIFQMSTGGLILGNLFGNIISSVFLIFVSLKNKKHFLKVISISKIKEVLKTHIKFPKYNMLQDAISTTSNAVPIFMFFYYFGNKLTGQYSMALTLSFIPIQILYYSIYQVYAQKLISLYHQNIPIRKEFILITKRLFLLFLIPFIIAAIFSNDLVTIIVGSQWKYSGIMIRLLIPWLYLYFIVMPFDFIPKLSNKFRTALIINISHFVCRVIVIMIGVYLQDILIAIINFSILALFFQIGTFIWYLKLSEKLSNEIL